MSEKEKEISVQITIDLDSLKLVGKQTGGDQSPEINKINQRLTQTIEKTIGELTKWIYTFNKLIIDNKHHEAYVVLFKNKETIQFKRKAILEDILKLDTSFLKRSEKKEFSLILFAVASSEVKFGKIETHLDQFLEEFSSEILPEFKQSILVAKANASAQNEKYNTANFYYKKAIENTNTSSLDKAFAFRGLAIIAGTNEDIIFYHQLAGDKFLEVGDKNEAVKDYVRIATLYENDDPEKALLFIDMAINLYDDQVNLDSERLAGLYFKKSIYLKSLHNTIAAFEYAEKCCELREPLFGNEIEKYSGYQLCKLLAEINGNSGKFEYYNNKALDIAHNINDKDFELQSQIEICIYNNIEFGRELLDKIEQTDEQHLKFSSYILNASNSNTFEKQILFLDKAKSLLNERYFSRQHFSLFYFTSAEIYRKRGDIPSAIKNYDLCLEHDNFYFSAIQNCGALLWENEQWEESKSFFQKQIERLGESPILLYTLARSYYELKMYKDAFNVFIKINSTIDGVDIKKYLHSCIERDKTIKLEHLTLKHGITEIPISLPSFKEALERFSSTISKNSRMHFWKNNKGTHQWAPNPEEKAKHLLITALNSHYGEDSIEIIQERPAGAGIIDLFINLRGGLKIVIELKICGAGYSSTYALSGDDQLIHYLKNTETKVAFLVIFDGRLLEFGIGVKPIQTIDEMTLFTIPVDMMPKILKGKTK